MRVTPSITLLATLSTMACAPAVSGQGAATSEAVTGGEVKCVDGKAKGYACQNTSLVSFLPPSAIGGTKSLTYDRNTPIVINDIWGWTDSATGREFALVGRVDGVAFVEVTNPTKPKYLGDLPLREGVKPSYWRSIKVYKNHAFVVSDAAAGLHGMQVFDLTQLRKAKNPPVTFKETAHYDGFHSAHNIVINPETGFAYTVGNGVGGETCGGALHMIDIRDPLKPTFAGCYAEPATGFSRTGYTHDSQCLVYRGPDQQYKGREICFNASESAVGIADVTDKKNPKTISIAKYPNTVYSHQGWLSEDQRYFFLNDEMDEGEGNPTRTIIFDVSKLSEPTVAKEFFGTSTATDHNLYVRGRYMYQANYKAGLRVIDVQDPVNPKEVGYFDTTPTLDNVPGYAGAWSNYPYFKSGVIGISSISEGLFLVRFTPPKKGD